jgi:hypothetical protein
MLRALSVRFIQSSSGIQYAPRVLNTAMNVLRTI